MNAVLELKSDGKIAAYNEFRAQLSELAKLNSQAVFDYEDPKGNKEARSHIYKLRQTKSAVEKTRKDEKAEALEYGRKVDAEAKEIISEIEAMIEVHETPIKEIEQREKDRVARHEANLAELEGGGTRAMDEWMELPLDCMKDRLAEIEAEPITEEAWEEFVTLAAQKKDKAIAQLREAIAKREKYDAEQAELERLRKEAAEREQKEREERIAREAVERAEKEAAAKRQQEQEAAERKAKQEREAIERERMEAELRAERAEREKREAQDKAKREAEEAVERERKEQAERERREKEEAEKREANKRHKAKINNAALAAFKKGGVEDTAAKLAVELIAKREIPHVTISY